MVNIRLGFHLSIKGDILNPAIEASEKGYGDFQMFVTNPRSWKPTQPKNFDPDKFRLICKKEDVLPICHLPYLFNLANPNASQNTKSMDLLNSNLEICDILDISYVVVHIGSHMGSGIDKGIKSIYESLNDNLEYHKANVLFENNSGYKNSVGSNIEEIADITNNLNGKNFGVCLDTCHAFAAGYDIRDSECLESIYSNLNKCKKGIKVVHLNDAKYPLGSKLDRHWHIGKGYIGIDGFKNIFRVITRGNFIMETPTNEFGDDFTNYKTVKGIIKDVNEEYNLTMTFR